MSNYTYDASVFLEFCCRMRNCAPEERQAFIARSKSMPYEDFLNTPYWAMIRGVILGNYIHVYISPSLQKSSIEPRFVLDYTGVAMYH